MTREQEIFIRKILSDPRLSEKQKSLVVKLAKRENSQNITNEKIAPHKESEVQLNPQDVATLMSIFDKDGACGFFLHPNVYNGEWSYKNFIKRIREELRPSLKAYSIPNNLRALLYKFIFGKYGRYTYWTDFEENNHNECCDSETIANLCVESHPLLVDKTKELFHTFSKSIKVTDEDVCNLIKSTAKYMQKILLQVKKDFDVDITDIQNTNFYFYTNAVMFYIAFRNIIKYVSTISAKCTFSVRPIILDDNFIQYDIKVRYERNEKKEYVDDFLSFHQALPNFLKGLCYIYYEAYFDVNVKGTIVGYRKIPILGKDGEKGQRMPNLVDDNSATITLSFFRKL